MGNIRHIQWEKKDWWQQSPCKVSSPDWIFWVAPGYLDDHDTGRYANRILGVMPPVERDRLPEPPPQTKRLNAACDDVTPPIVMPHLEGDQGGDGWYRGDVTVGWQVYDSQSPRSPACGPTVINTDTTSKPVSCTATSGGGEWRTTITIKRDTTPPVIVCPVEPPQLVVGSESGDITAAVNDTLSGAPATATATLGADELGSVGPRTVGLTATDNAGNSTTARCDYRVVYVVRTSPDDTVIVGDVAALGSGQVNTLPAGKPVRVEFDLNSDQGLAVIADGHPKSESVACETGAALDAVETVEALGNQTLSYDPNSGTYTFPWKTNTKWQGTCRQMILKLADNTEYRADFQFS